MIDALLPASWAQQRVERSGYELLAWAVLEQAACDLAIFARYGIVTSRGKCLPWPTQIQRRFKVNRRGKVEEFFHRMPRTIASSHGPNDHKQLVAWFKSKDAQSYCDLLGCQMPARQIFKQTIKAHGGHR
jgi:hypothetical protein